MFSTLLILGIISMFGMVQVIRKTDPDCWVGYFLALFLFVFGSIALYGSWRIHVHSPNSVSVVVHTPK